MAAHAANSLSGNHLDGRSGIHTTREHDVYKRDYDVAETNDMNWEQEGYRQRRSPALISSRRMQGNSPFSDQRYQEGPFDAPSSQYYERDHYKQDTPEFVPFRGGRDFASVDLDRERYEGDARAGTRGHHGSYNYNSVSRWDGSPSPGRREDVYCNNYYERTRASASRRPSPTYSQSQHSRPPRQPRNPRARDFLAQSGNPNAMPIGKRGAEAIDDTLPVRKTSRIPPTCLVTEPNVSNNRQLNGHIGSYTETTHSASSEVPTNKARPLSDIPPNIHPSRHGIVSRHLPVEGGRHIANMRAPRKQLDNVAQSIESFEKRVPDFLTKADNANAVPLGKKMRF